MKAVVKNRQSEGLEIVEMPAPAIKPDEVLIKVLAASICGSDIHIYHWDEWARSEVKELPRVIGHEFAGRVEDVGPQVRSIRVGDYVSAESHVFCLSCPACLERKFHLCQNTKVLGFDRDGCFAEYVALPERVIWKNDADLPLELASVQEPLGNAVYCVLVEDVAAKTVAVFGDGPAGLFASEVARVSGAREVILVGIDEYRLSLARSLGCDVVDASSIDPASYIIAKTGGRGADVVLEMSGAPTAVRKALESVKWGGRFCAFGLGARNSAEVPWNQIVFSGLTLYGIHGRLIFDSWVKVKNLLKAGKLNLGPIITHRFPLRRYAEAFELAASRKCGKIILYPQGA